LYAVEEANPGRVNSFEIDSSNGELKAINSKESVSVNEQLTEFIVEKPQPQFPTTEEERLAWIARSKAAWAAALGMTI
jgi:6-phosphogluconolactonase (cycloisomerase 2 family)